MRQLLASRIYVLTVFALSALFFVVTGIQFWVTAYLVDVLGELRAVHHVERGDRVVAHQRLEQQLRRDERVVRQVELHQRTVLGGERSEPVTTDM